MHLIDKAPPPCRLTGQQFLIPWLALSRAEISTLHRAASIFEKLRGHVSPEGAADTDFGLAEHECHDLAEAGGIYVDLTARNEQ